MKKVINFCLTRLIFAVLALMVSVITLQVPAQAGECIACHTSSASSLNGGGVGFKSILLKTSGDFAELNSFGKTTGEDKMQTNKLYVSAAAFMPIPDH